MTLLFAGSYFQNKFTYLFTNIHISQNIDLWNGTKNITNYGTSTNKHRHTYIHIQMFKIRRAYKVKHWKTLTQTLIEQTRYECLNIMEVVIVA